MKEFVEKMDRSKVIKASAGTGKTYRLSLEILVLLFSGVEVGEVFSITFTRKAAAEIRDRVIAHLSQLLAYFKGESEDCSILKALQEKGCNVDLFAVEKIRAKLLTNKQDFQVMTIDAFINSVFSGLIAPYLQIEDFVLIDASLNEEIIDEVLVNILRDKQKKQSLNVLIKLNKKLKNLSRYKQFIKFVANQRFILEKIHQEEQEKKITITELKSCLDKMVGLIIQTKGSYFEFVNKNYFQSYEQSISEKDFLNNIRFEYKAMLGLSNFWSKVKLKEINEELTQMYEQFKETLASFIFQIQIVPLMLDLQELLTVILGTYDEIKFRKRTFTYQDIAYYTYKYLYADEMSLIDLERGEVLNVFYEALSSRVKYLLIDEFQDTSVIQWNILFPLIKELSSGSELSGGVICVGDDKQAIYGWRGGEKDLLNNLEQILTVQEAEVLKTSYRSSQSVMLLVNEIFLSIANNTLGERNASWQYEKVACYKQENQGYVQLRVSRQKSGEYDVEQEIEKIVETFSLLLAEGKLHARGTAILLRTSKEMEQAAVALKKRGIPFVLDSSSSILDHKAVKPVLYLLKYLVTGQVSFLFDFIRSDYLGYSLKAIAPLLKANSEAEDVTKLTPFLEIVSFLKDLPKKDPLEQIIIRIFSYFQAGKVFSQLHDQKNIRKFLETVRDFQLNQSNKQSIADLLRYFEQRRKTESFRQVGLESSDSVQIMTIHKSKGMEFDNVFYLLNLAAKEPPQDDYLLYAGFNQNFNSVIDGVVIAPEDKIVIENHASKKYLFERQNRKTFLEELNTIYVALTRAKQNLFFSCMVGKKYEEIAKQKELSGSKKDVQYFLIKEAFHQFCSSQGRNLQSLSSLEDEPLVIGELTNCCLEKSTVSSQEETTIFSPSREGVRGSVPGISLIKKFDSSDHEFDKRIVFAKATYIMKQFEGSMVHEYLSNIKYNEQLEHELACKVLYQKYGDYFSSQDMDKICKKCSAFVNNHLDVFSSKYRVFTEYVVFDGTKEYRVDRLMIDDDAKKVFIVDYKTGEEKEQQQLDTYQRIVSDILGNGYKIETRFVEF